MAGPATVDAYLADLPADRRAGIETLRQTVVAAAPDAAETISYQMPALYTRDGRLLVSYAAFKQHYSLFPASGAVIAALGDELTPYLAGKATLRFPASRPIPTDLVTRVVKVRLAETEAG